MKLKVENREEELIGHLICIVQLVRRRWLRQHRHSCHPVKQT